jgi:Icc protein
MVHFAHITDIHLSAREQPGSDGTLIAPRLMRECMAHLNTLPDLDFVLFTGDVLDIADQVELEMFLEIAGSLHKPWHFIPGNHDGFIDPAYPHALKPHEVVSRIDPRLSDPLPAVQQAFWSRQAAPGIQLVALDTRLADDWAGVVSQEQIEWLRGQLEAHRSDLVIVATHHPLHALGPHNTRGRLHKFICSNGTEIEAVLDQYPNVRLVISGHHHASHLSWDGGDGARRLRIVTAALSSYPCSYRTVRLEKQAESWQIAVQTHSTASQNILQETYQRATELAIAHEFAPDDPHAWPTFCAGRPEDRHLSSSL